MVAPTPIEQLKAMKIGCDNVVMALLKTDSGSSVTYETAKIYNLPGVMSLNINPNTSIETAFYDDGPGEVASSLGNIEVSFTKSSLGPKEKAILLGKSYVNIKVQNNANEKNVPVTVHSSQDTPPWVAIGFRTLKSDGTYRFVWLLKGKFIDPADNNETKTDSINFQSDEITGRFVKTNIGFTISDTSGASSVTKTINPWKTEMDETDIPSDVDKNKIMKKWFEQPVLPNTSLATTSI